jgi:branched-chain amino acid aminotransferase
MFVRRFLSSATNPSIRPELIHIDKTTHRKSLLPEESLKFGTVFTDHMMTVEWTKGAGWAPPRIMPFGDLTIHPAASSLHYAVQAFEGMKAFRGKDGDIRLFRPDLNMARFTRSVERLGLAPFGEPQLLQCIRELVKVDSCWVPHTPGYSLYIRPTAISTTRNLGVAPADRYMIFVILSPVGPYYATGFAPVSLYAETRFIRAAPGGTGSFKVGANYGPTIMPQKEAGAKGYAQILWLYGEDHQLTEVGTMNLFVLLEDERTGEPTLVTPPLDQGLVLPGVTRASVLDLVRSFGEIKVEERIITMDEVRTASHENRLLEAFGTGTAAVISPVKSITFREEEILIPVDKTNPDAQIGPLALRIYEKLTAIMNGEVEHPWSTLACYDESVAKEGEA